jgi:hypothetical protein
VTDSPECTCPIGEADPSCPVHGEHAYDLQHADDLAVLVEAYKSHATATLRAAVRYEAERDELRREIAALTADRDDWMHLATEATAEAARYRRQAAGPEAENDYRGLIRVIGECDSAQARVDAVKMLCDSATDLGFQHVPVWRLLRALDGRP